MQVKSQVQRSDPRQDWCNHNNRLCAPAPVWYSFILPPGMTNKTTRMYHLETHLQTNSNADKPRDVSKAAKAIPPTANNRRPPYYSNIQTCVHKCEALPFTRTQIDSRRSHASCFRKTPIADGTQLPTLVRVNDAFAMPTHLALA